MKQLLIGMFLVLVFPAISFAGTITVTYAAGDEARVQEGITSNGAACNVAESLTDCTARIVKEHCAAIIKGYEMRKDAKTAREAVTAVSLT